jgi:hypothetical protein
MKMSAEIIIIKTRIEELIPGATDRQKLMLFKMCVSTWECELDIPKEFWCDRCKSRHQRVFELTCRFVKMNRNRILY